MRALYNVLLVLGAPIWWIWMLSRTRRRAERPDWGQRLGHTGIPPKNDRPRVWFHAVSVGEVVASLPILRELKALVPRVEIILSVTTSSGNQTAREQASDLYSHLVYFPLDFTWSVTRALNEAEPDLVAVMETELWMNFLAVAKQRGSPTMVVNGRISDRSFRRSLKFGAFFRALLANLDLALMQTDEDARRIAELGAKTVRVLGNCKFDQAIEGLDADPKVWRDALKLQPGLPVVVVGSTRGPEEEDLVLEAVSQLGHKKVNVVHAPRHLERVPDLYEKVLKKLGSVALRSEGGGGTYVVLDTYGELSKIYAVSDLVVIGGGFEPFGGQNLLQPLAHGKPVLHGPHMHNFSEVASAAAKAGCTMVCDSSESLARGMQKLLDEPELRKEMGEAARTFVKRNVGASRRYAEAMAESLKPRTS